MELSTVALAKIVTNQTTERPPAPAPLPEGYQLGPLDICNGRGRSHWNMPGNVDYRYECGQVGFQARLFRPGYYTIVLPICSSLVSK
jgi:hypothetical protein